MARGTRARALCLSVKVGAAKGSGVPHEAAAGKAGGGDRARRLQHIHALEAAKWHLVRDNKHDFGGTRGRSHEKRVVNPRTAANRGFRAHAVPAST